jgi:hypothetical protein
MARDLCTTINCEVDQANDIEIACNRPAPGSLLAGVDMALEWVTEKLDRKFVTAMERCHEKDLNQKREMNLLKRIVLVLLCVGLGLAALSMRFAPEAQVVIVLLG